MTEATSLTGGVLPYSKVLQRYFDEAWPIVGARLVGVASDMVLMGALSREGNDASGAANVISSTQLLTRSIPAVCLYQASKLVRIAVTQKNYTDVGVIFQLNVLIAIPLSIPGMLFSFYNEKFYLAIGEPEAEIKIAQLYQTGYAYAIPLILMLVATQQIFSGLGKQKHNFYIAFFVRSLAILLGYVFLKGLWGAPDWGARGLGYSVPMIAGLNLSIYLFLMLYKKEFQRYALWGNHFSRMRDFVKPLLFGGGWISVYAAVELISVFLGSLFMGRLGGKYLSLSHPAFQWAALLANVTFMLGITVGMLVSGELANEHLPVSVKYENAKRYVIVSVLLGLGVTGLLLLTFFAAPKKMIAVFVHSDLLDADNGYHEAYLFLMITLIFQHFDVLRNVIGQTFKGYDSKKEIWWASYPAKVNVGGMLFLNLLPVIFALYYLKWVDLKGALSILLPRNIALACVALWLTYKWKQIAKPPARIAASQVDETPLNVLFLPEASAGSINNGPAESRFSAESSLFQLPNVSDEMHQPLIERPVQSANRAGRCAIS